MAERLPAFSFVRRYTLDVRPPALTRDQFLASDLRALTGYWLRIRCIPPCTKVTFVPMQLLASRARRGITLAGALARLRCKDCGALPKEAAVVDDLGGGDPGAVVPAREVVVMP